MGTQRYPGYSYYRCLPALNLKLRFLPFCPIQVEPFKLESQNQAKNIPKGSPEFPNLNLRQIGQEVHELRSDHTEITTL